MTREEMIQALRNKASEDKVASDIFFVCAMRERSRASLTIAGLAQRMKAKGYHYERHDYEKFLAFLGSLGLGDVVTNRSGRVRALKNIKITLKSIGNAALNKDNAFIPFKIKNHFTPLMANKPASITKSVEKKSVFLKTTPVGAKKEDSSYIKLIMSIDDKPWEFNVPQNATNDDIARLIDAIRHK